MNTSKTDWRKVAGEVVPGHGVAASGNPNSPYPEGTIDSQKPVFLELGVDIRNFYSATLNVSIAPYTFKMIHPRYHLNQVRWTHLHPPENFSLSPCRLTYSNRTYDACIYYPHPESKARHFKSPSLIEILAPWVEGIGYGSKVELELNSAEVELQKPAP